ncbi:hypothetical protein BJA01nite_35230 [Bradyrhizobium japonicum]|jgi:hypothetical protein|nr:hypothetical protein BJ6T_19170 [Bradyrhizobium japonicum USDA 6]GEC45881.1 hypothetical protein BJA01nite_35230 [Bradyrhizobium japonicum]
MTRWGVSVGDERPGCIASLWHSHIGPRDSYGAAGFVSAVGGYQTLGDGMASVWIPEGILEATAGTGVAGVVLPVLFQSS